MRVTKCDSCGVIIDASCSAHYCIAAVSKVDKRGGSDGWKGWREIDLCDACWGTDTLVGLEALVRGSGVTKDAPPLLVEAKDNKSNEGY